MSDVRATAIRGISRAVATLDGETVILGLVDASGHENLAAIPRQLVPEFMGHLTMAFRDAGAKSHKPGQQNLAAIVEKFSVSGSTEQTIVTILFQIASRVALEFALSTEQASDLSTQLATAAAVIAGKAKTR